MKNHTIVNKGIPYTFPLPENATEIMEFLGEQTAYYFMRKHFLSRISQWIASRIKRGGVVTQEDLIEYRPFRGKCKLTKIRAIKQQLDKLSESDRLDLFNMFCAEHPQQKISEAPPMAITGGMDPVEYIRRIRAGERMG